MSKLYTPEISNYKTGTIINVDSIGRGKYTVKINVDKVTSEELAVQDCWGPRYSQRKNGLTEGKFGDLDDDVDSEEAREYILQDFWENVLEPRLLPQ